MQNSPISSHGSLIKPRVFMVTSPFSIKLPFQLRSPMGHQTWGPRDTKDAIRSFDACGPTQADLGGFFKRGGLQTIAMALVETTSITTVSMVYDAQITMVNGLR